jgi:hypothetical protein
MVKIKRTYQFLDATNDFTDRDMVLLRWQEIKRQAACIKQEQANKLSLLEKITNWFNKISNPVK